MSAGGPGPADRASVRGMSLRIDLNADLGESFGTWIVGDDEAMLGVVTSANVACGFHAGDATTIRRTVAMAAERGRLIVPHCWKTGIGIAASVHLAAVTPHCPFVEFLPADLCDSLLRKELVRDELELVNGEMPLPRKPGLGIEVDRKALQRFEDFARRRWPG